MARDGYRSTSKVNAQTLQSAYQNGILSSATAINITNPFHSTNQPHVVNTTSTNIPSDLSWGVREVFFNGSTGSALLSITGVDTSGKAKTWHAIVSTSGGSTTVGEWVSLSSFVGTTGQSAGEEGLVPAPSSTDVEKVLTSRGTWGYASHLLPVVSGEVDETGAIILNYLDGTSERMVVSSDGNTVTVTERDSNDTATKTYTTTIAADGSFTVTTQTQ